MSKPTTPEAPTKTTDEEQPPQPPERKAAQPWRGPTLTVVNHPFYLDDSDAARHTEGRGIAPIEPVQLTEAQWKRRTPAQWGTLVGAGAIRLTGLHDRDRAVVEDAEVAEVKRLARVKRFTAEDSVVMSKAGLTL
jgi:hypothetical protein